MIINPDGTFWLDEGELFPFVCPRCSTPSGYDAEVVMVKCLWCGYLGIIDEFSTEIGPVQQ